MLSMIVNGEHGLVFCNEFRFEAAKRKCELLYDERNVFRSPEKGENKGACVVV